jgi:hypothetical protein
MKTDVRVVEVTTVEIHVDLDAITPLSVCESSPPNGRKRLERPDGKKALPSQPYVRLDGADLLPHLRSAHMTSELDRMAPYLWLVRIVIKASLFLELR